MKASGHNFVLVAALVYGGMTALIWGQDHRHKLASSRREFQRSISDCVRHKRFAFYSGKANEERRKLFNITAIDELNINFYGALNNKFYCVSLIPCYYAILATFNSLNFLLT